MLDRREIIKKKNYFVRKLLMNNNSEEEKVALKHSLGSMIQLLKGNEELCNVRLYNLIDEKAFSLLSLTKGIKQAIILGKLINPSIIDLDDDYLLYLLQLTTNVRRMYAGESTITFDSVNVPDEDVVELSKEFYNNLGNEEITSFANKIFNDPSHYGFSGEFSRFYTSEYHKIYGVTVLDRIFDKAYISVLRINNIFEYQVFSHEVMHAINYYIKKYSPIDVYQLYVEVASLTIDHLYSDFLEEKGFDYDEVRKLRKQNQLQAYRKAQNVFDDISLRLIRETGSFAYGMFGLSLAGVEDLDIIRKVLTNPIIKQLFFVESHVIAYGLYKQILEDREKGLENLCKLMKEKVPNDKMPDFSFIGLDRRKLIELSKEMGSMKNGELRRKK